MANPWRTIRVFVSSTFRDMYSEREMLAASVFPVLRERCRSRRIHLIDVDLRWGIPSEESEATVLSICLKEIARANPFFVGFLAERWGWVPPAGALAVSVESPALRDLVPDASITALELAMATLDPATRCRRALVYLREPGWLADAPAEVRQACSDSEPNRVRLERLKNRLADSSVTQRYTCKFGGFDAASGLRLDGLEVLATEVTEDLWQAICEEYPDVPEAVDDLSALAHAAFKEDHTRHFVGRGPEIA